MSQRSMVVVKKMKNIQAICAFEASLRYTPSMALKAIKAAFRPAIRRPVRPSKRKVSCIVTGEAPG